MCIQVKSVAVESLKKSDETRAERVANKTGCAVWNNLERPLRNVVEWIAIRLKPQVGALLLLPLLSSCSLFFQPTEMKLLDEQTLLFKGPIKFDTDQAFRAALTPQVTKVVLDSSGGEVIAGLKMGRLIFERGLDIEVNGMCMSSCANYLFTAGKHKTVRPGSAVGFHGEPRNSKAVMDFRKTHTSPQAVAYAAEADALADQFYADVGINPRLYAYSVGFTTSNRVQLWLPSPRELNCMGIGNLDMWFSTTLSDFKGYLPRRFATSAQDRREPKPDICSPS